MTTRKGLVAKKGSFRPKNDDEKRSRRQKREYPAQKRRRERVSSPKIEHFSAQNNDEKGSRRQKIAFLASK
ncbi:hypothetical protein LIZ98_12595 [Caldibacillus sp. 210928-DFI.2.18]|uniref:hypothetical protein n=1 Tax=unclassified Caldibacillus TaxID=2641266 RepID=UPI001D087286|nr:MULTISPECIES: hypothetical protein [unclassified Caldibacillus]MCB7074248.1 hypothetical protein [Caldibacillus sp. 210928-DFI.2.18]